MALNLKAEILSDFAKGPLAAWCFSASGCRALGFVGLRALGFKSSKGVRAAAATALGWVPWRVASDFCGAAFGAAGWVVLALQVLRSFSGTLEMGSKLTRGCFRLELEMVPPRLRLSTVGIVSKVTVVEAPHPNEIETP